MSVEYRKDQRQHREEKIFIEILSASSGGDSDSVLLECTTKDISKNGLNAVSCYSVYAGKHHLRSVVVAIFFKTDV